MFVLQRQNELVQNNVTLRFISTLQHLQAQGKVGSIRQFALSLDYYPQSLNDILKGRRDVTVELLRKVIELYNFNALFLFSGEGPMISNEQASPIESKHDLEVPLLLVRGRSEYIRSSDRHSIRRNLPNIKLHIPSDNDQEYCAFEIDADHLSFSLLKGEIIICRKLDSTSWANRIYNDFCYCMVTEDDIIIERVVNSINDDNTIILNRTLAEMVQKDIINISEIKEIWEIKMKLTHDVPQPNNVKYRTDQQISDFSTVLEKQCESISSLHVTINRLLKQNRVSTY